MIEGYKKYLHYNVEMEKALIGACLLEQFAFSRLISVIDKGEIFHDLGNEEVFGVMMEMYKGSYPIDLLTVVDYLYNQKKILTINNSSAAWYLTSCTRDVVSAAHLEYHALCILELWKRRKVIEIKYSALKDDGHDPKADIQSINAQLNALNDSKFAKDWYGMDELIVQLYEHQDSMKKSGGIGILSGFKTIDQENGGFFPGNMIFIGARPSVGKSAFANSIAIAIAEKGKKVGVLSLEMSNVEIAARIAAIDTNTDYSIVYRGLMRDEIETQRMYERLNDKTVGLPIFVSDKTDVSIFDIRRKAENLKSKEGLDVLIIDYLQLIGTSDSKSSTRENEVAKISRGIKILAKDLGIPIIILGQLNREVTKRNGEQRYPVLGDIRESGAIEQDADIVMFLHSDFMSGRTVDENQNTTEGKADLVVRKWRDGKNNFIIPLNFEGRKMKFTEDKSGAFENAPINFYEKDTDAPF